MTIEICIKSNSSNIIEALYINLNILITINLFLIIKLYGFGIGINDSLYVSYSFLSSDNMTASYIIPAIPIALIYSSYKGKKITMSVVILYICIISTIVRMWSVTTIIGCAILFIYIIFIRSNKLDNKINFLVLLIISIALIIGIVFFQVQYSFQWFFSQIFNKSLTFTGRTFTWALGINEFIKSPLFGMGNDAITIDNGIIQILYRGGISGLLSFIGFFMCATSKLFKTNNSHIQHLLSVSIFTIIILSIAESWFYFTGFYIIMSISYYYNNIEQDIKLLNSHSYHIN